MARPKTLKGKTLSLKIGTPAVDYFTDATSVTMSSEEASTSVVTFEDAQSGEGRQWFFNLTAVQSTEADSLWSYIWSNSGDEVAFTYAPHANATPTADEPHFTGTVVIGPPGDLGGDAARNGADYTFPTRWDIVGTPLRVTA